MLLGAAIFPETSKYGGGPKKWRLLGQAEMAAALGGANALLVIESSRPHTVAHIDNTSLVRFSWSWPWLKKHTWGVFGMQLLVVIII